VSPESGETGEDDEDEDADLEETEEVLKSKTPLRDAAVDEESESDDSDSDRTLIPTSNLDASSVEKHLSCVDRVSTRPSKQGLRRTGSKNDET
jgi:hypothetical protein